MIVEYLIEKCCCKPATVLVSENNIRVVSAYDYVAGWVVDIVKHFSRLRSRLKMNWWVMKLLTIIRGRRSIVNEL